MKKNQTKQGINSPLYTLSHWGVELLEKGMHQISILSLNGKKVKTFSGHGKNQYSWDLNQSGLYWVKISTESGKLTRQVLIT